MFKYNIKFLDVNYSKFKKLFFIDNSLIIYKINFIEQLLIFFFDFY